MSRTMKHSPLPWIVSTFMTKPTGCKSTAAMAWVNPPDIKRGELKNAVAATLDSVDDAKFIVHCCNHYEETVIALRTMVTRFGGLATDEERPWCSGDNLARKAALKQAKDILANEHDEWLKI